MRMSSYFSFAYKVLRDKTFTNLHMALVENPECKIVHFGMHGSSIDTFITTTLASRLQASSVKCIVLNMCKSAHIANDLRDKAKTENVEDNAARAFSEAFYHFLCVDKKSKYLKFKEAFDHAKESLELRGYLLIDPVDKKGLEDKKSQRTRPDLVAAGILVFCGNPKQEVDQTNAYTTEVKAFAESMDIDTLIGRDDKVNGEKQFSDSDLGSSKKRRRNADFERTMSDDNDMDLSLGSSSETTSPRKVIACGSNIIEGKESTCKLKCIYEFVCGNRIEANCKFIHYLDNNHRSLSNIKDIYCRDAAKSKFVCNRCNKNYCGDLKIPSNQHQACFQSCFATHCCQNEDSLYLVKIDSPCKEFSLKPKKREGTNTKYTHCRHCKDSRKDSFEELSLFNDMN